MIRFHGGLLAVDTEMKTDFFAFVIFMALTIWALMGLCAPTQGHSASQGWNVDFSDHETYRGMAAHFGVGAGIGGILYGVSIKSKTPFWQIMCFGLFSAELANNIYEAYTNKEPGYWALMDVAAGAGVFTVGGVAQLGYWEGESARGVALRIPFK